MANQTPIPSRNSARPGMLEQPQSGTEIEAQVAAGQASIPPVNMNVTPTPTPLPPPSASDELTPDRQAELMSELEAEYAGISNAEIGPDPGFFDTNLTAEGLKRQKDEAGIRALASFAVSDKELKPKLEQHFGKENVIFKGGQFKVRREKGGKFTNFDSDTVEILSDIMDASRNAVEEAVAVPFEIAGAAKGGTAGLAGGAAAPATVPAGAIAGAALGRATGAAVGTNVADLIAQNLLDIERDPERSRLLETGLAATLTAGLGAIGDKIGMTMARKAAAKRLAIPEHEAISTSSKELLANTRQLRDLGMLEVGPGGKVTLLPHQVDPSNPRALAWAKEVSSLPAFGKLMKDQAETADKLITDTLMEASKLSGKGPLAPDQIAKQVTNIASDIRKAEGNAIGEYRRMAGAKLGNQVKVLPDKPLQTLFDLTASMGFAPGDLKGVKPTKELLDTIQGTMGIGSEGEARFFFNQMQQVASRMQRGTGMSFDDLGATIDILAKGNKQARRAGGEASALYNRLSSELRGTRNDLVRQNLPESMIPGFEKSMARFQDVMAAQDNLGSTLSEDIANKAFVNDVFSQGKAGLGKLQSAKTLLQESHPQVWDSLKASYMEQLLLKNTKETADYAGKLDAGAIKKQILGMGQEAKDILFDGEPAQVKNFMAALDYGQRIKDTSFTRANAETKQQVMESFMGALANSVYMKSKAVLSLVGAASDKPSAFMEMLSDEGVDQFFGQVKPGLRNSLRQTLSEAQDQYRQMVIRGASPTAIAPVRRATRSTIREKARGSQYESAPETETKP